VPSDQPESGRRDHANRRRRPQAPQQNPGGNQPDRHTADRRVDHELARRHAQQRDDSQAQRFARSLALLVAGGIVAGPARGRGFRAGHEALLR
jgi:hypothetical protein